TAFIGRNDVDLTGIRTVGLEIIGLDKMRDSNWEISIRTGSSNGQILGSSKLKDVLIMDDKIVKINLDKTSRESGLYIVFNNSNDENRQNEAEIRSITLYN